MEDLKVVNGKIQLDDGSEIDFKPVFAPQIEYSNWNSDASITLVKVNLDEEEYEFIKDKPIHYKETNFIEEDFWFDLESFHLALTSNSYLYERIYNLKFIIVFFNPNKELIKTLNFSNN